MDYNEIKNFFEKFKKIIYQKEEILNVISSVISKELSFEITRDVFDFKNGIIYLKNNSPILRTEIFLRKKRIIEIIQKELPSDIRILDIK